MQVPTRLVWTDVLLPVIGQWLLVLVVAGFCGFAGLNASMSALLGGMSIALPNVLIALRWVWLLKSGTTNAMSALFGAAIKILLAIALLWLTVAYVPDVQWLYLILNVIVATKAPLLVALWLNRKGF